MVVSPARLAAVDGPAGVARAVYVNVLRRDGQGAWGGRAVTVRVTGSTAAGKPAQYTVSGSRFRAAVGLRASYFGFAPA